MTLGVRLPPVLWAAVSYLGLTVLLTYPLVIRLGVALPSDPGDPMLNTWILWWNSQALPLSETWWSPPVFFPAERTFALSEHLLGLMPIAGPVQLVTGNPVLAYNAAFLLSFPLSGVAAYLLTHDLTDRGDAAWIAGLAYGVAPYRFDQLAHLQVLSWYWVPVVLFALHRYLRDRRLRWLGLFLVAYLMQGLVNGYLFLFLPVLVVLWVIWFVPLVRSWPIVGRIALAGAAGAAVALPILLRYHTVHRDFGFERSLTEVNSFSADLTALLSASPLLALWGWMSRFSSPEGQLFPGLSVACVLIAGVAALKWPRQGPVPRWLTALRVLCAVVGALFLAIVASRWIFGPWELTVFGLRLSVTQYDKPFSFAALFLTALALLSPVVVAAHLRRSVLGFYLLAGVAMWILTWGPFPTVAQMPLIEHGPYNWLRGTVPGFADLRVPARFWILATACLSVACGQVIARLTSPGSTRRTLVVGGVALGLVADAWVSAFPLAVPPSHLSVSPSSRGSVLELPLGRPNDDLEAMFRQIRHGRPIVNGFSGYTPPHYALLTQGLARREHEVLALLGRLGVRDVFVIRERDLDGRYDRFLAAHDHARFVSETPALSHYRLGSDQLPPAPVVTGQVLPVTAVSSSANSDLGGNIADGNLRSRWPAGDQRGENQVLVDLGRSRSIRGVRLAIGPFVVDSPHRMQIEVSADLRTWQTVWGGPTTARAIEAAIRDPRRVEMDFPCVGCEGRYVRLQGQGRNPAASWSIAELSILGLP